MVEEGSLPSLSSSTSLSLSSIVPIIGDHSYREWLLSHHITVHPDVHVHFSPNEGYHLVAKNTIPAGTLLIDVPFEACCLLRKDDPFVRKLIDQGIPGLYIASLLYLSSSFVIRLGGTTGHYGVLQSLQNTISNVIDWKEREKQVLRGTTQESSVGTLPVRQRFRELILPIVMEYPEHFTGPDTSFSSPTTGEKKKNNHTPTSSSSSSSSSSSPLSPPFTADQIHEFENRFVHACHIFLSRGFHSEGSHNASHSSFQSSSSFLTNTEELISSSNASSSTANTTTSLTVDLFDGPHLVPFADLLNHHSIYACTQLARVGNNFRYYSLRSIQANEQIFASYGNLSDGQLLHTYGFTLPVAEHISSTSLLSLDTTKDDTEDKIFDSLINQQFSSSKYQTTSLSSSESHPPNYHFTNNPANNCILPTKIVLSTLKSITSLTTQSNPKSQKVYDKTVAFLRQKGLLPSDGFMLQRSSEYLRSLLQPPSSVASTENSLLYSTHASSILPKNLTTVVQVLLQDSGGMKAYMDAYDGNEKGNILYLPLLPVSTKHKSRTITEANNRSTSNRKDEDEDEEEDEDDPETAMQCWSMLMVILRKHLQTGYPTSILDDYIWWMTINNPSFEPRYYKAVQQQSPTSEKGIPKKRKREENTDDFNEEDNHHYSSLIPNASFSTSLSSSGTSSSSSSISKEDDEITLGKKNYLYKSCRLIGLGEKEFVLDILHDIMDDLEAAEEEYGDELDGEEEDEVEDDDDDVDDDD